MKKLIFIDNDNLIRAKHDVELFVSPMLQSYGNLNEHDANDIEIISDLYKKDNNELYQIFFSGKTAIISFSVYTPTSFHNSNQQLFHFLRVAGKSKVNGIVYLDMSGMLHEALDKLQYTNQIDIYNILKAIETNQIISLKETKFVRLRLDFENGNDFRTEEINLKEVLNN